LRAFAPSRSSWEVDPLGPSLLYCQCCHGVFARAFFVATSATRRSRASQRVRDQTLTEPSPPSYKIMGSKTFQQVNSVVCASGAPPGLCVQRAVQTRIQAGAARLPRNRTLQGGVPASTRFGAVTGDGRCLQRGTAHSMRPSPGSVAHVPPDDEGKTTIVRCPTRPGDNRV